MSRRRNKKVARRRRRIVSVTKGRVRHGRRGASKLSLNLTGIKRSLQGGKPVIFTAIGAVAARVLYGLGMKYSPTTDPRLIGAGAVLSTIVAGIAASGRAAIAVPIAVGAAGIGLVDMFASELSGMVPADQPEIAQAIQTGIGKPLYTLPAALPLTAAALPSPDVAAGLTGYYPDQYGVGEPDQYGIGDVDMVYY